MQVTVPTATNAVDEAKEQEALFRWRGLVSEFRYPGIGLMFAIPNGAYLQGDKARRAMQWVRLRKQGARPGVSDVFLPVARGVFHGLWLEMKVSKGRAKVSDDQAEWIAAMRRQGYQAHVAYGWSHAVTLINDYYGYSNEN